MSRRDQTTSDLRRAAFEELLGTGPRALSHGSVARRAHYSEASVYQRWPDRRSLMADLMHHQVVPQALSLAKVAHGCGPDLDGLREWLRTMVGGDHVQQVMQAVAELCFAARDDEEFREPARLAVQALIDSVPVGGVDEQLAAGLRWWMVGYALGHSLLVRCGCSLPDIVNPLAKGIERGSSEYRRVQPPATVDGVEIERTFVPRPGESVDDVSSAILSASRQRIVNHGLDDVTLRDVSRDSGVTTGALYRRFASRDELLSAVVAREGLGDQYRWLLDLLVSVSSGFESDAGSAALRRAADVARRVWSDPESRTFLLEMAVAAHTSESVRERLAAQVHAVVDAREAELLQAAQVGLVQSLLTAAELTWFLQTPPVALRLMSCLGIEPTVEEYQALLRLVAVMLWVQ